MHITSELANSTVLLRHFPLLEWPSFSVCWVSEDIQYLDDGQLDNPYSGRVSAGNYTEVVTTKAGEMWLGWMTSRTLLLLDSGGDFP